MWSASRADRWPAGRNSPLIGGIARSAGPPSCWRPAVVRAVAWLCVASRRVASRIGGRPRPRSRPVGKARPARPGTPHRRPGSGRWSRRRARLAVPATLSGPGRQETPPSSPGRAPRSPGTSPGRARPGAQQGRQRCVGDGPVDPMTWSRGTAEARRSGVTPRLGRARRVPRRCAGGIAGGRGFGHDSASGQAGDAQCVMSDCI